MLEEPESREIIRSVSLFAIRATFQVLTGTPYLNGKHLLAPNGVAIFKMSRQSACSLYSIYTNEHVDSGFFSIHLEYRFL